MKHFFQNTSGRLLLDFFFFFLMDSWDQRQFKNAQEMDFSIKDFFSKCDQIHRKLWSHLLKKSLRMHFKAFLDFKNKQKISFGQNKRDKNALFLWAPTHHSFTFNLRFIYELKHKVPLSKTVCWIYHFWFRLVFVK